jgi:hypothetical protein
MNISAANGMIPGDPPDGHSSAHKKDTATTVELAWDSLKGSLLQFRTNRFRDARRRALDGLPAGLRKALETAWTLVSVT